MSAPWYSPATAGSEGSSSSSSSGSGSGSGSVVEQFDCTTCCIWNPDVPRPAGGVCPSTWFVAGFHQETRSPSTVPLFMVWDAVDATNAADLSTIQRGLTSVDAAFDVYACAPWVPILLSKTGIVPVGADHRRSLVKRQHILLSYVEKWNSAVRKTAERAAGTRGADAHTQAFSALPLLAVHAGSQTQVWRNGEQLAPTPSLRVGNQLVSLEEYMMAMLNVQAAGVDGAVAGRHPSDGSRGADDETVPLFRETCMSGAVVHEGPEWGVVYLCLSDPSADMEPVIVLCELCTRLASNDRVAAVAAYMQHAFAVYWDPLQQLVPVMNRMFSNTPGESSIVGQPPLATVTVPAPAAAAAADVDLAQRTRSALVRAMMMTS